jgi:DNA-binding transcriptional regulator YiaG
MIRGTMSPSEVKTLTVVLDLTYAGLARLLGVGDRAVSLWVLGRRVIPGPADRLMRLLRGPGGLAVHAALEAMATEAGAQDERIL